MTLMPQPPTPPVLPPEQATPLALQLAPHLTPLLRTQPESPEKTALRTRLYQAICGQNDTALQQEALTLALLDPDSRAAQAVRDRCTFRVN